MEDGERIVQRQSNGVTIRDSLAGGERACSRTASLCYSTSFEMRVRGCPDSGKRVCERLAPVRVQGRTFRCQADSDKALPS